MTIHRDLVLLEEKGALKRIHGGAVQAGMARCFQTGFGGIVGRLNDAVKDLREAMILNLQKKWLSSLCYGPQIEPESLISL